MLLQDTMQRFNVWVSLDYSKQLRHYVRHNTSTFHTSVNKLRHVRCMFIICLLVLFLPSSSRFCSSFYSYLPAELQDVELYFISVVNSKSIQLFIIKFVINCYFNFYLLSNNLLFLFIHFELIIDVSEKLYIN